MISITSIQAGARHLFASAPIITTLLLASLLIAVAAIAASLSIARANADYICTRIIDTVGVCTNGSWSDWEVTQRSTDASGNTIENQRRIYTGQRTFNTVIEYLNLRTQCDPGFEQRRIGDATGASGFHGGKSYTQFQVCQIAEGRTLTRPPKSGDGTSTAPVILHDPTLRQETFGAITGGDGEEFDSINDVHNAVLRAEEQRVLDQATFKLLPKLVRAGQHTVAFWASKGATSCLIEGANLLILDLYLVSKPPARLSITHIFGADVDTDLDIGESGQAAPHHDVAGRRIVGSGEVTTKARELGEIVR